MGRVGDGGGGSDLDLPTTFFYITASKLMPAT